MRRILYKHVAKLHKKLSKVNKKQLSWQEQERETDSPNSYSMLYMTYVYMYSVLHLKCYLILIFLYYLHNKKPKRLMNNTRNDYSK